MKRLFLLPCLLMGVLFFGTRGEAEYFQLDKSGYTNDVNKPNECLPINQGRFTPPVFGKSCRNALDGIVSGSSGSSSGDNTSGSSSSGDGGSSSNSPAAARSPDDSSGSSSSGDGPPCPDPSQGQSAPQTVDVIACENNETCTKDCTTGTPVCTAYALDSNNQCQCTSWQTPQDCTCEPKCTIQDPVNYPYCCSVTDKGPDYPCLKVCTLPNGDTVDIEENPPRCKKFKDCCYGKRDQNGNIESWDPVETEPGDPRDYCKLKCQDSCNDKVEVPRSKTASDIFPECCTPPIPLSIVCACCRDNGNQPSSLYCEYFHRFFSCDEAVLNCPADPSLNQCTMTVSKEGDTNGLPQYDPNHDPYLAFDPRYAYCSGLQTNRNCRYICRGSGILLGDDAPVTGIWAKDYVDANGNPVENNHAIEVHGNCTTDQGPKDPIPWPPPNQALETCNDTLEGSTSSTGGSSSGQ